MSFRLLAVQLLSCFNVVGHLSKWFTFFASSHLFIVVVSSATLAGNGWYCRRLGFLALKFINIPNVQISTKVSKYALQPRFWQYLVSGSAFCFQFFVNPLVCKFQLENRQGHVNKQQLAPKVLFSDFQQLLHQRYLLSKLFFLHRLL
jgi:hypothetical protein